MKIKAFTNKIYRVNPNAILCDVASFGKLKEGHIVDLPNKAAEELTKMGVAEKAKQKSSKKE